MDINKHLKNLELELVAPETRSDQSRLELLLDKEFIEVGSSGVQYTKSDVMAALPSCRPAEYSLCEFQFRGLSADCVLVMYHATANGQRTRRSSVWVERDGDWKMLYHQSTPMLG